jgi:hypothetical protein
VVSYVNVEGICAPVLEVIVAVELVEERLEDDDCVVRLDDADETDWDMLEEVLDEV